MAVRPPSPPAKPRVNSPKAKRKKTKGSTIEVANNETLLEAGEDEDWDLPYACRQGQCLSCGGKVQDGDAHEYVQHSNNETLGEDEVEKGYILTCTAYPTADLSLETNETP